MANAAMASLSERDKTAPVGLCGELIRRIFVRLVTALFNSSVSTNEIKVIPTFLMRSYGFAQLNNPDTWRILISLTAKDRLGGSLANPNRTISVRKSLAPGEVLRFRSRLLA